MALELVEINKSFGRRRILDRLSLSVPDGVCYGLLGGNGAGKTTAMRVLLGMLRAEGGEVRIDGRDPKREPLLVRAASAGLLEAPGFFPGLSARRNLLRTAALLGIAGKERAARVQHWLDVVGLSEAANRPAGQYSQGMRQRLGLAQALIGGARNLLLDEPMNGLDPAGIAEIREVIRRLVQEEGRTVLVSSHQLKELEGLCDVVGILHAGRLVLEGPLEQLLNEAQATLELQSQDPERLRQVLRELSPRVSHEGEHAGVHSVRLSGFSATELIRFLVLNSVPLSSVAPRHRGLEAVYLEAIAKAKASPAEAVRIPYLGPAVPRPAAPELSRSPAWPLLRVLRYEAARSLGSASTALSLCVPALVGAIAASRVGATTPEGPVYSSSVPTAFEAVGEGLRAGLPLLALVVIAGGALSIASERGLGTLKNLVTAPVLRAHILVGKLAIAFATTALGYGLLLLATGLAAQFQFQWTGPVELLENGILFEIAPTEEMWPLLNRLLTNPLLPLLAITAVGFCLGNAVSRATSALVLALGTLLGLVLLQAPARSLGFEGLLPTTHLPTWLAKTSWVDGYVDLVRGAADVVFRYEALVVPSLLSWLCLAIFAGSAIFIRRSVR